MKQAIRTFIGKADKKRQLELEALLAEIAQDLGGNSHSTFGEVRRLHFASLVLFEDKCDGYGAYLVCEVNFDGPFARVLAELIEHVGQSLYRAFRCCADYPAGDSYDKATLAAYLLDHTQRPHAFHIGNPGRTVERIRAEARLREAFEERLDAAVQSGDVSDASSARRLLQEFVAGNDEWAWVRDVEPRVTVRDSLLPWATGSAAVLALIAGRRVFVPLGIVGLLMLRQQERRDPMWSEQPDQEHVRRLDEQEDVADQNHMANLAIVKPGPFRRILLRLVLGLVDTVARGSTKGTLSGIPSIHYAHWSQIDGGRRLLFLSNFDGSWENYLDDFIDKASAGLTAVWSNTVGFPRTCWLFRGGARDGPRFKAVARARQSVTNVWYSAYPTLTVQQIDRNSAIREGLFAPLTRGEEAAWLRNL